MIETIWEIRDNHGTGKFHLFHSLYEHQTITGQNYVIKSSGVEELLGVATDSNLNFKVF